MNYSDKIFRFGNFERPLDLSDCDLLDTWESAMKTFSDAAMHAEQFRKTGRRMRAMADALMTVFDTVFGNGSANELFGESVDLTRVLDAYDALLQCGTPQVQAMTSRLQQFQEKYAPKPSPVKLPLTR